MNDYVYEPSYVHPRFRINGNSMDACTLLNAAYDYIKEGKPFEKAIGVFLLDWFDPKPYVIMKTSGTTGTPKTIQLSKRAMINSALATSVFFKVGANTHALHCLPAQYIAGRMMLVRAIIIGWDIDVLEPSSTPLAGNEKTYDFAAMVPLQAEQSLGKLSQVKKIILGGGKVSSVLSEKLQPLPVAIWETYAMTETVTHVAAKRIGETAFTTLPGVKVTTDARGCLVIDAPKVADMPVVTNDLAEVKDVHRFTWLGRYDNVINSGGIKLFPEQVEEKLAPYLTQRFFVYGLPDEVLGEKLILVVEGSPVTIPDQAYSNLDKYEKPKTILFVNKFAETGSGKVQRGETVAAAR
ncbi:AMP-binding protein [Flavobacterium sp. RHBU_24]|uniref:AMP-binding protein n=1 Tax=Flavobacterium sp. RHBU_24 TaxID=3391185 RepID=UPI00398483F3